MPRAQVGIERAPFGTLPDGRAIERFTLRNGNVELRAMTYGAAIVSLRVPDRLGRPGEIVHGFDTIDAYVSNSHYTGAIVGRFANRIAGGRFGLDGKEHHLAVNNGLNHLHGGVRGFDKAVWRGDPLEQHGTTAIRFRLSSPDGDEGYPGNLEAEVAYSLTPRDELVVDYSATTDRPTIVNLAQHSYFHLGDAGMGDILGHELTINADRYLPITAAQIPTGAFETVAGTPFDFRVATPIGARIESEHPQVRLGHGYDHTWILNRTGPGTALAARLRDPKSGRRLDVRTTEPGIHVYSGNFLDDRVEGRGGRRYGQRSGVALETQHFPDSPNQPGFPSVVLRPGEVYRSQTVFAFSAGEQP